ncbi:MAG: protein kinase, partial [Planctomycetaceae bacterium]|nr:protein kinase [Planctomycetaceae bacterium]
MTEGSRSGPGNAGNETLDLDPVVAERDSVHDSHANAAVLPGQRIGEFTLIREIGRGGMGVVYEAWQTSLRRTIALKVLPLAGKVDQRQIQRFRNESMAAAQLEHPNIVPVYSVGVDANTHYYAMQLIVGRDLAQVIQSAKKIVETRTARPSGETPAYMGTTILPTAESEIPSAVEVPEIPDSRSAHP